MQSLPFPYKTWFVGQPLYDGQDHNGGPSRFFDPLGRVFREYNCCMKIASDQFLNAGLRCQVVLRPYRTPFDIIQALRTCSFLFSTGE